MTYRRDSDFPLPYGTVTKVKDHPTDPAELDKLIEMFGRRNAHRIAKGKKNKAAWFVSNCDTMSHREKYVKALQRYFEVSITITVAVTPAVLHAFRQVDIYGECGPKKCDRSRDAECWSLVESEYKFYLSLENSLCTDYVTEKFFNALARQVVPVTMGGGDYDSLAPKRSHLDIYRYV